MAERDQRRGGQSGPKAQPWNLFRIKEVTRRDGEVVDEFQPCGVAWPKREGEGFTIDVHFALPEGARLMIAPRKTQGGGR